MLIRLVFIIIYSVNFENGKSFSKEHDRKYAPAWKNLKKYSDEITAEIGLSVIRNAKGKGASHYDLKYLFAAAYLKRVSISYTRETDTLFVLYEIILQSD